MRGAWSTRLRHALGRWRRLGLVAIGAAALLVAAGLVAGQPASAGLPSPGQSGPPSVIDLDNQPNQYLVPLQNFENNAVSEVLSTHGLPSTDAEAVLGWGRDDVRAQEWLDLGKIINDTPAERSANDQLVYQWFQSVYGNTEVAEAQDAINEYLKWTGGSSLSDPPQNFGPNNTGYCNYSPPGGSSGPFSGSYTGNTDQTCFTPCTSVLGCAVPYPTIQQFQEWGAYDELDQEMGSSDFANSSLGTIGAIAMGGSLAAAGVTTALSASFGGAGISSAFISEVLPFAARVAWQSASSIASSGLSAGADATEVAAAAGAEAAGAITFVVGVALFFIVSTTMEIIQLVQNADIPTELSKALSAAQADTSPDLASDWSSDTTKTGLFAAFLAQTMPDVDYTCSSSSTDPCADAPTPPGPTSTDDQFMVSTTTNGVTTTVPESSIYTVDQRNPDFISTRLGGGGWFVSTRYNGADPADANAPEGTPGATFESLQFFYTDWNGEHWDAERIFDSSGNPEFVVAPVDASSGGACSSTATVGDTDANNACITSTLDIQTPNGTDETVTVVPAYALAPSLAANVPAIATTGVPTALGVTGTDPNGLPLTYSWTLVCPGSTPQAGFPCFGGEFGSITSSASGPAPTVAFPTPGAYTVDVTASDSDGYKTTRSFTVNSVSLSTTTVTSSSGSHGAYGPVTFTATVNASRCVCYFSGIPLSPDGAVQFIVDGVPAGNPVPVSISSQVDQFDNYYATAATAPISSLSPGPHTITADYLPDGAKFGFVAGPADVQPGFYGSDATMTYQVSQAPTTVSLTAAAPGEPVSFTATVTPSDAGAVAPTGLVQFYVDGKALGSPVAVDSSGTAVSPTDGSLSATPPGGPGHVITATYSGDQNYGSSAGTLPGGLTVEAENTITSLTSSVNPAGYGGSVTYTATVAAAPPATGSPTGTVTFTDGSATLGTTALSTSGGVTTATITVTASPVGSHPITATYNGDAGFLGSASTALTENVTAASTATKLASSVSPSIPGQAVTYTATVTPTDDGGTVAFADGGTAIGGCAAQPVNASGQATCKVTYRAAGSHSITATYSGDTDYHSSTSTALTQTVVLDKADLKVTLGAPAQAADGTSVTETVTVTNTGPAIASKVVTVLDEPDGLTVTNADGAKVSGRLLTWRTDSIAPGASVTFAVTVKVGAHVRGAEVIALGTLSDTPDPRLSDNFVTARIRLG